MHPGGAFGTTTNHGFTGHEQLDETFLTHMNGRVYDYRLGRFLSVDPLISNPASSQAINPYSYLGNNPFSGVDPTGYECVGQNFSECTTTIVNGPGPQRDGDQKKGTILVLYENGKYKLLGYYQFGKDAAVDKMLSPESLAHWGATIAEEQRDRGQSGGTVSAMVASTLLDHNGKVLSVANDRDLSIYRPIGQIDAGPPSREKVGETHWWDTFLSPETHKPIGIVHIGEDITDFVLRIEGQAAAMRETKMLLNSRSGGELDIKLNTPGRRSQDGYLLDGKYVTLREAGNMIAGYGAATHGFSFDEYMKGAGAYAHGLGVNTDTLGINKLMGVIDGGLSYVSKGRVSFEGPPWYGEQEYTGRAVQYGFNTAFQGY
jgi:RHS repeat-associated protein